MSRNLTRLHQENPSIYRLSAKKVYNKFSSPAAFSAAACFSILLKEEGLQPKMYKAKLIHCSDLVPNLVVEIEIFNFCLFVYLFVCTSHFPNFARGKWSNHDSKNFSEIRTVTWSVIWLWKMKFSIFVCLFVPHVLPILQNENGSIMIPKTVLKSGLLRGK